MDGGRRSLFAIGGYEEYLKEKGNGKLNTNGSSHITDEYLSSYTAKESDQMRHEKSKSGGDKSFVDYYYRLVTDFYEFGWGDCFHFAPLRKSESFQTSMRRHEYYLALRLGIKPTDHIVDMGCGIGGPARYISAFTGAKVTGVTINEYQVARAQKINEKVGNEVNVNVVQADFMTMPFSENSLDGAYAIESLCHTSDRLSVCKEAFRVLKPGAYFTGYDWVITDRFDSKNLEHLEILSKIEKGNGLAPSVSANELLSALKHAGFDVIDSFDSTAKGNIPWWTPFLTSYTLQGFATSKIGRWFTYLSVSFLELIKLVPKGSAKVQTALTQGADGLVEGGEKGIFTVGFFFLARKPV